MEGLKMEKLVFKDMQDLWSWLYANDNQIYNDDMDDFEYGDHIDNVFEKVCERIEIKGFAVKHGKKITLELD